MLGDSVELFEGIRSDYIGADFSYIIAKADVSTCLYAIIHNDTQLVIHNDECI